MKLKRSEAGYWYAHIHGHDHPFSLKTKDKAEAERLARDGKLQELEWLDRSHAVSMEAINRILASRRLPLRGAILSWKSWASALDLSVSTIKNYEGSLWQWVKECGIEGITMPEITPVTLDRWINDDSSVKASTRECRVKALRHFFGFCHASGFTLGNPAALVDVKFNKLTFAQKEPKKKEVFTGEELHTLYTQIPEGFWYYAIRLGNSLGLRISDCCLIGSDQINEDGQLVVWMEKVRKRIVLPMPIGLVLPPGRPCFPLEYNRYKNPDRRAGLSQEFTDLIKRLGIQGKSFHSLRHTFATRHKELGLTVDEIRLKLGHSSTATTEGYIHA